MQRKWFFAALAVVGLIVAGLFAAAGPALAQLPGNGTSAPPAALANTQQQNVPLQGTPTSTPSNTPTNTAVIPTSTPSNTPTRTAVAPTSTPSNTPTNTAVIPTSTPSNTPTNTAVVPTSTPSNTPTNTAVLPTAIPSTQPTLAPPTLTATAVPPTLTATTVPPTLTRTAVPPTLTATAVPPTLTRTAVPPTLTATAVPPTLTRTAVPPTLTTTSVPATSTATRTATPAATATCGGAGTPGPWVVRSPVPYPGRGIGTASDGVYAYTIGGYDQGANQYHNDTYRYDPVANTWTARAPAADAHFFAPAVYANNGKIYDFGGFIQGGGESNLTRIYDIAANIWSTGAPIPQALSDAAAVYNNGTIYLIGGFNGSVALATTYAYDIAGNSWSTRANLPQGLYLPGFGALNGQIYIAGGANLSTADLNTLYIYNIAANTWSSGPVLPTGVTSPGSTVLGGKLVLFGGGFPPLAGSQARGATGAAAGAAAPLSNNLTQIYDPGTNAWGAGPPMNVSRLWFYGTTVGNTIVAPGGQNTSGSLNVNETSTGGALPCATPSATPVPPSATPINTPTATRTAVPNTPTLTVLPTATSVPPSVTVAVPTGTTTPQPPTVTPTVCVMTFSDVPTGYWAYGYIYWVYCHGIVSGYADNTFRPENNTTRAQIAKMVVLAAGFPLVLPPGGPHFADVPPTHPFYTYIEVAYAHGVVSGYADGTFRPYNYVTRAQLAKMIVVARGLPLLNPATPTFNDVPPGYWAYRYIETAVAHNIVGGYDCGGPGEPCPGLYFRPDHLATRAQLAKMIYQAFALPSRAGAQP